MMNTIVFLDAATVDWGDQDLAPLKKAGKLKAYPVTRPGQTLKRASGFKHVITNKVVLDRTVIEKLRGVEAIHVAATGVNNVDLEAAREHGIAVTNVRGYSTESVVQLTFAAMLSLALRMRDYETAIRKKIWSAQPLPTLNRYPFFDLHGKTLGIIGFGNIGKRVAEVAEAFGMHVLAAKVPGRKYPANEKRIPLEKLLEKADIVSIHAPLSSATKGLIGAGELRRMKKTAFLLNMARGGIVDETALAGALRKGTIAGAALDVLGQEPPPRGHVLYNVPHLILTPHIAWASFESRTRLVEEIAGNILSYEKGGRRSRLV